MITRLVYNFLYTKYLDQNMNLKFKVECPLHHLSNVFHKPTKGCIKPAKGNFVFLF